MLEPFGTANKKPCFSIRVEKQRAYPLKKDSPHFYLKTNYIELLNFNGEKDVFTLNLPVEKTLIFEPNYSIFRDKQQVKGYLKKIIITGEDFSKIDYYLFRNSIRSLLDNSCKNCKIDYQAHISIISGEETLYVASNYDILSNYAIPNDVKIHLFNIDNSSNKNAIVISPTFIPNNFDKVVCLDKPLCFFGVEKDIVSSEKYCKEIYSLSTDREVFANIFSMLCSLERKSFFDVVDFVKEQNLGVDIFQFIFTFEVFVELGIFYVEDGCLRRNKNLKNALTNSIIYNKICNISEEV